MEMNPEPQYLLQSWVTRRLLRSIYGGSQHYWRGEQSILYYYWEYPFLKQWALKHLVLNFSRPPMHQPMWDKMELPNRLRSNKWRFNLWMRGKFLKTSATKLVNPGARNLRVTWSAEKKTQKCRKNLTILRNHLHFFSTYLFYLRKRNTELLTLKTGKMINSTPKTCKSGSPEENWRNSSFFSKCSSN